MDIEKSNKLYSFLKFTFFVPMLLMVAFYLLAFEALSGGGDPLQDLAEYIYDYGLGLQVEQTIEIKKLDSEFWDSMDNDTIKLDSLVN